VGRTAGHWVNVRKKNELLIDDYTELWQAKDAITTMVEANGYAVYDLRQADYGFRLELNSHINDEAASYLCGQLPLSADYFGEGSHGLMIELYKN